MFLDFIRFLASNIFFFTQSVEEMEEQLGQLGLDASAIRGRSLTRKRKRTETDDMDVDYPPSSPQASRSISVARSKSAVRDRSIAGLADTKVHNFIIIFT